MMASAGLRATMRSSGEVIELALAFGAVVEAGAEVVARAGDMVSDLESHDATKPSARGIAMRSRNRDRANRMSEAREIPARVRNSSETKRKRFHLSLHAQKRMRRDGELRNSSANVCERAEKCLRTTHRRLECDV